jgi:hypothetical protein
MKYANVHLLEQSEPCEFSGVRNTYQKGDLFCVMLANGDVYKFPLAHIFRIKEWRTQ